MTGDCDKLYRGSLRGVLKRTFLEGENYLGSYMILRPQKGYVRNIFRYTCDKESEIKGFFFLFFGT